MNFKNIIIAIIIIIIVNYYYSILLFCVVKAMFFFIISLDKRIKSGIGNSVISSDIWHKYHKTKVIFQIHEWYLCQISCTNYAIICLYYYPQKVCNFFM